METFTTYKDIFNFFRRVYKTEEQKTQSFQVPLQEDIHIITILTHARGYTLASTITLTKNKKELSFTNKHLLYSYLASKLKALGFKETLGDMKELHLELWDIPNTDIIAEVLALFKTRGSQNYIWAEKEACEIATTKLSVEEIREVLMQSETLAQKSHVLEERWEGWRNRLERILHTKQEVKDFVNLVEGGNIAIPYSGNNIEIQCFLEEYVGELMKKHYPYGAKDYEFSEAYKEYIALKNLAEKYPEELEKCLPPRYFTEAIEVLRAYNGYEPKKMEVYMNLPLGTIDKSILGSIINKAIIQAARQVSSPLTIYTFTGNVQGTSGHTIDTNWYRESYGDEATALKEAKKVVADKENPISYLFIYKRELDKEGFCKNEEIIKAYVTPYYYASLDRTFSSLRDYLKTREKKELAGESDFYLNLDNKSYQVHLPVKKLKEELEARTSSGAILQSIIPHFKIANQRRKEEGKEIQYIPVELVSL